MTPSCCSPCPRGAGARRSSGRARGHRRALSTKPWLPRPLRPPAALAVHTAERMAERYLHLILAERGYVTRFARPHPVVPNTTYVPDVPAPPDGGRRVMYVGHLS